MHIGKLVAKSFFNDMIHERGMPVLETTAKSIIYADLDDVVIVTTDPSKMLYYIYAQQQKYRHIPNINYMAYDHNNKLCYIERERLFPCVKTREINEIQKTKLFLTDRNIGNKLSNELLSFFYDKHLDHDIEFDFGPHWIMRTQHNKLVVADAFKSERLGLLPK